MIIGSFTFRTIFQNKRDKFRLNHIEIIVYFVLKCTSAFILKHYYVNDRHV
jgi:hypothetical protein